MKIKCKYCDNKATNYRTPDIDIKGVPLCEKDECFLKLLIEINGINLGK